MRIEFCITNTLLFWPFSGTWILSCSLRRHAALVRVFTKHSEPIRTQALADVSLAPRPPEDHPGLSRGNSSELHGDLFSSELHLEFSELQPSGLVPNAFLLRPNGPEVFRVDDERTRGKARTSPAVSGSRGKFPVSLLVLCFWCH